MSKSDTWNRVGELFAEALERPPAEREPWLRKRCAEDPKALDEVLGLLRAREQAGEFLKAPMLDFKGHSFGPYKAIEEIGRGGMSIVYLGRRADGDFDKQVAIKVILVQSSTGVRQSETQILAGLEHANIARLLDAGRTELGFRYLLMEYVEGKPFTRYCADKTQRQKLRLFLDVCEAVQFAHRSLVVHRDLKPDNILVTGAGVVKLLDFGIAKILDPQAGNDQTMGVRAFSPNYASPEQLLGQPVTTSTDVYSLGVLLCELLGGRPPRLLAGLTLEQMVDSARGAVRDLPLKGDLAAIARKALQTDPSDRYDSAGALARDIVRFLEGLPIEARNPSWGYRAGRFLARHRISATLASIALASLVAALAMAVVQARKAETRFNQVRELAGSVMFELHDKVRLLPGSLEARQLIVDRSLRYLDALAADPDASEAVRLDLAKGYLRLSEIEGKDHGGASIGRSADALRHALLAVEIARPLTRSSVDRLAATNTLVDALDYSTTAHTLRGEVEKSIPLGEEAVRLAESMVAQNPASWEQKERLAAVTKQLADSYSKSPSREKALPLFLKALAIREALLQQNPDDDKRRQRLAEAHQWTSSEYWWRKDYPNSEKHARAALQIDEIRFSANPGMSRANVASDSITLAMNTLRAKRYEETVSLLERALALRREILGENPTSAIAALRVAAALNRLGLAHREWGRYPEAIRYGTESVAEARRISASDPKNAGAAQEQVFALSDLALTFDLAGQKPKACLLAGETLDYAHTAPLRAPSKSVLQKMGDLVKTCPAPTR